MTLNYYNKLFIILVLFQWIIKQDYKGKIVTGGWSYSTEICAGLDSRISLLAYDKNCCVSVCVGKEL